MRELRPLPRDNAAIGKPERGRKARREWYDSILDRLDAVRVLRADDDETKGALLEEIAELGEPEYDIARELLAAKPLAHPDRFEQAHRSAMRALEVLDRNGGREAAVTRLGPLNAPATFVVSLVAGWITSRHSRSLAGEIRGLYQAREANAVPGTTEHRMLRRARLQAVNIEEGYGAAKLGVPGFLLTGAALSTSFAVLRNALGSVFESTLGTVLISLTLGLVVFTLAWGFVYGAAVARRRIRLSTDGPIRALWEAVGACGDAPRDHSLGLAVVAILLLIVAWLAVPVLIWLLL